MDYKIDISNSNYETDDDFINITLENGETINVNYSTFFIQSKYIKNTYNYSEGLNLFQTEIDKVQRKLQIDKENIKQFFQLIQYGQANISLDNWKKIYLLSEHFDIPKLKHELNNFIQIKLYEDLSFTIQMFINSNQENNIESNLSCQIEDFLTKHINECFENPQFSSLPIQTIYRIIQKAQQDVKHNLLIDFILKSADKRFTLFLLVDYRKLTEEKRQILFDFIDKQTENARNIYLEYIKFDFNFIQIMKKQNDQLMKECNQIKQIIKQKNLELIDKNQELSQMKQEIDMGKTLLEGIKQDVEQKKLEQNLIKQEIEQEKTVLENTKQDSNQKKLELNQIKQEIEQEKTVLEITKQDSNQKKLELNQIKQEIEHKTVNLTKLSIQNMKKDIKILYVTVKNRTVLNFNFLNSLNAQNQEFSIQLSTLYEEDFMNIIKFQSQYLNVYDIILLGGCDCFPSYSNLTQNVINDYIFKYHQNGGIILFLHTLIYDKYVGMFQQLTNLLGFRSVKPCGWQYMYNDVQFNTNSRKNDIISYPFSFVSKKINVAGTHINAQFNSKYTVLYHDNIDNPYYSENVESRIANCEIGHTMSINSDEQKLFYNIICHLYGNCKNQKHQIIF